MQARAGAVAAGRAAMSAEDKRQQLRLVFKERLVRLLFHAMALILVAGATCAAIVNKGLGWSPSPDLVSNQVYDATVLRFVKHLVDNPQVKLPFLAYEGAVWLKSTTAAQVLLALMSLYLGLILPGFIERVISPDAFLKMNRWIVLSTLPALFFSVILHVFVTPIPQPSTVLRHGDWMSGYLQRMLPCFLVGWSMAVERRAFRVRLH